MDLPKTFNFLLHQFYFMEERMRSIFGMKFPIHFCSQTKSVKSWPENLNLEP